ncbi:hypothetical protein AGMMS49949_04370 [Alphaproteobacteria bacterium]|nr:hypothetical protein AGMMS49949_04370 [Alphaproteobacteria bacterium]GHS95737.1 hypothetical protein AGMMS50296_0760 [Alphaproteobacteria bacterium]
MVKKKFIDFLGEEKSENAASWKGGWERRGKRLFQKKTLIKQTKKDEGQKETKGF